MATDNLMEKERYEEKEREREGMNEYLNNNAEVLWFPADITSEEGKLL